MAIGFVAVRCDAIVGIHVVLGIGVVADVIYGALRRSAQRRVNWRHNGGGRCGLGAPYLPSSIPCTAGGITPNA